MKTPYGTLNVWFHIVVPYALEVLDSLFITQGILPNRIRPQAPDGGKKNHGSDQPSLTFAVFRHARKRAESKTTRK